MSNALAQSWRRYRALPRLPRELATLALMLLVSLTLLPAAIWFAGQVFLGDYIRDPSGAPVGGFGSLWLDYLRGILAGSFGYWLAFLGPWLVLIALRGMAALRRHERRHPASPQRAAKGDINQPLA